MFFFFFVFDTWTDFNAVLESIYLHLSRRPQRFNLKDEMGTFIWRVCAISAQ